MGRIKVMSVFGTRPEAIKMAPLALELAERSEQFDSTVVVTAQHREMLDQVLDIFNITPQYDLNIMRDRQSLAQITSAALEGLDDVMQTVQPHIVLVHGDTSTTFAAALAAFYNRIPIGHVEAGLRTWNKYSPYPEEMNRQMAGVLTDLHFAPTTKAKEHLIQEGKRAESIFVTGNTAIDALQVTVKETYEHPLLHEFKNNRIILVTAHRRENIGNKMEHMFKAIKRLVSEHKDVRVIYPVHLNPAVKQVAETILGNDERIKLIEPLPVIDFHNFLARAHLILTDSGGIQEEAPSLGVPVLVLRDTTERPEGIEAGTLKLAGTNEATIFHLADTLLRDRTAYEAMAQAKNPYGDGKASKRIVEYIDTYFHS